MIQFTYKLAAQRSGSGKVQSSSRYNPSSLACLALAKRLRRSRIYTAFPSHLARPSSNPENAVLMADCLDGLSRRS
jgi:hypothetical protein